MGSLVAAFQKGYDAKAKDAIWQQHCATFHRFWRTKVMPINTGPIPDIESDAAIQILDRNGKGNTKESEAVARAMVPQGVWRKLFNSLHTDENPSVLLDSIFKEEDANQKIVLIDKLYKANEKNKNWLTGSGGNVLNALLAAYNPVDNLTMISLADRKTAMDFLGLQLPFDWNRASYGQRIVQSNLLLREGTRALGVSGTARTLSCFWYFPGVREQWRPEDKVKRPNNEEVSVTVPVNSEAREDTKTDGEVIRESLRVQAALAGIGAQMGFQIWLPRADRERVLTKWKPGAGELLDELPVGFDRTTMKIIEQIDVLWVKRRAIVRAFEVEHTTSVYSGLLRMADLLAMQPNLKIKLHIVAPVARREKVLQEIRRPVFSLLEGDSLSETCTYLSYEMVEDLRGQQHLVRLSDAVLEDYEEKAQGDD